MRSLVTGAAGFIGSHLCRRLVADGQEVVGFDDLSSGTLERLADVPEVRFVEGDLRDADALRAAAEGSAAILHQGAMRSVPLSLEDPGRFDEVNVRGTRHVLEAAREVGATVVFASSSSVYGDRSTFPLREDMDPRPLSPYAASKLAGEAYCRAWWSSFGVRTVSLRYFNAYGPGQDPESQYAAVIPRFATACLDGFAPVIHGTGEQARDFTYIDDVVEANLRAARAPDGACGGVLNVGGGRKPTTINELLAMIRDLTGSEIEPLHEPARIGDIPRSEADISMTRRLLGFEPRVDIAEGLHRTVEWFRTSIPAST